MVKWSSRNESFEDLETRGKTKSGMNKAVKGQGTKEETRQGSSHNS